MKKLLNLKLFVLAGCLSVCAAQAQTAGQDMKNAGHDTAGATKDVAHSTAHGTKVATHKTVHATKTATHDTAHGTSVATHKTVTGTRNVGRRIEGKPTVPNNPQ